MPDMYNDEEYQKLVEELLGYKAKDYQDLIFDDYPSNIFSKHYKNSSKDYFDLNSPGIVTLLHKTDELLIEYYEQEKKYICKYVPLDITVTIPASMLGVNIRINYYYGIGMRESTKHNLAQICSRIVFAIKNFSPTLNAINDRIESDMKKKLDTPWSICYIREKELVLEGPDWEIMERA